MFRKWGELKAQCPGCGYVFEREEGYWLGGMIVNVGVAQTLFVVVLLAGMALTWPDVPWTWITVVSAALMVLVPIWLYPRTKLLWIWLDLKVHPYTDEERPEFRP